MRYTVTKKTIALILSVVCMLCLPFSICANAAGTAAYPVIYVPDMSEIVLYQNPNTLSGNNTFSYKSVFDIHSTSFLKDAAQVLIGLGVAAKDTKTGINQVNKALNSMLSPISCDKYGDSKNEKLGVYTYYSPACYNTDTEIYTENIKALISASSGNLSANKFFVFNYDWRLDPVAESEKLKSYIDKILTQTKTSKVRLLSGGYGGIIVNSYLYQFASHSKANVVSCVFLDTMMTGNSIIGDIMSGHIVYTVKDAIQDADSLFDLAKAYDVFTGADVGDALARYLKQDPGGIFNSIFTAILGDSNKTSLVTWLTLTIAFDIVADEGMFDDVGKGYKELLLLSENSIYSGVVGEFLRNMPGMWAMVPEEEYEDAFKFLVGKEENIEPELLEKIENYRAVQKHTESTLKRAQLNGINVDIVAGYGKQILPVTAHVNEQSDGLVATRYAGVGATTGDMNEKVKLESRCGNGNHDHMEPGRCLDAATCYLPENTWFIKNHSHLEYASPTAASFVSWLLFGNTQRTVYQNAEYPQYIQKAVLGEKIYAYSTPSEGETTSYTFGDANFDGKIDSSDARYILRYAVGLEGSPTRIMTLVCDVDGDGQVTTADARLVLRYAVGLENSFTAVTA